MGGAVNLLTPSPLVPLKRLPKWRGGYIPEDAWTVAHVLPPRSEELQTNKPRLRQHAAVGMAAEAGGGRCPGRERRTLYPPSSLTYSPSPSISPSLNSPLYVAATAGGGGGGGGGGAEFSWCGPQ